ncbi:unnamed protein product [Zymoseptoria tritici ST99CH_1A5]|uniref:Tat pathway signal sequence n=1 Tax=Zymoseptoria tritici ST99CH_1A5 TaxID=1276529 RepID=A0A1Y6LIG7_ZYMTR|nr:unnamed protein product [Zymoseptoria tritici ST99CH_1A5]
MACDTTRSSNTDDSETSKGSNETSPFLDAYHDNDVLDDHKPHPKAGKSSFRRMVLSVCGVLFFSSGWFVALFFKYSNDAHCSHMEGRPGGDNWLPPGSPLLEIDRSYHEEWFRPWNFTPSVWNEHPSKGRVDDLWAEKLGVHNHFFMIPLDQGANYDLDPRVHVTLKGVEGKYDGFPVNIEAIHQLHCLDALRRKLYMNRPWYKENWEVMAQFGMEEAHTSHCLDMIRQVITCRADLGVLGWKWVKVRGNSLPDFQRRHQCHNFEAVRDWSAAHQMPKNIQKYEANQSPPPDAIWADAELYHGDIPKGAYKPVDHTSD